MDPEVLGIFSTMLSFLTAILVPLLLYYMRKINQMCAKMSAMEAQAKNLNDWFHELKDDMEKNHNLMFEKIVNVEKAVNGKIVDLDKRLSKIEDMLSRGF